MNFKFSSASNCAQKFDHLIIVLRGNLNLQDEEYTLLRYFQKYQHIIIINLKQFYVFCVYDIIVSININGCKQMHSCCVFQQ